MTIKFFDNFGGYTRAQATRVWNSLTDSSTLLTFNTSGGRFSDSYVAYNGNANTAVANLQLTITASATLVMGLAFRLNTNTAGSISIISLFDAGTAQCDLRVNTDKTLSVTRNGTAVTGGTSTNALTASTWYYIEWKVTIADSIGANTCQVNVNGVQWINVTTGQDVKNTANATANTIALGKFQNTAGVTYDFSHFYYDDGTAFLGDVRIDTLTVDGDGTTQNFTSSSGTHHNDVDDATPDDDTTYVESGNIGDIELFTFSDLVSTPVSILAVAAWNCERKTDAGARSAAAVVRSGGSNFVQATVAMSSSFVYDVQILSQDPATSAAWTQSGVNAIQAGLKVIS